MRLAEASPNLEQLLHVTLPLDNATYDGTTASIKTISIRGKL
jgi:hypothetical protein